MEGFVYLIKNIDLFKIGHTENLERRMQQLKPSEVLASAKTANSRNIEALLHKRYAHGRIPQSEYFRLTDAEADEVIQTILKIEANGANQILLDTPARKKPIFRAHNSKRGISTLTEATKILPRTSFAHRGVNICIFQYPYYVYNLDGVYDSMAASAWNIGVLLEHGCEILPRGQARRLLKKVVYHFASIEHMHARQDSPVDRAYQEMLSS